MSKKAAFCYKTEPLPSIGQGFGIKSIGKILSDKLLQKLITVDLADETTGIVMICNICGVLLKDITDNLVDGIVTFFAECIINGGQNTLHLLIGVVLHIKLLGSVDHSDTLLEIDVMLFQQILNTEYIILQL